MEKESIADLPDQIASATEFQKFVENSVNETESKLTTAVQETKNTVNKQIEDCQNSLQTVQNDVKNRLKELFDVDNCMDEVKEKKFNDDYRKLMDQIKVAKTRTKPIDMDLKTFVQNLRKELNSLQDFQLSLRGLLEGNLKGT